MRLELGRLIQTCRWALQTTWRTSPGLMLGLGGVVLVRAAVPAGLALAARGLINAAVAAINSLAPCLLVQMNNYDAGEGVSFSEYH